MENQFIIEKDAEPSFIGFTCYKGENMIWSVTIDKKRTTVFYFSETNEDDTDIKFKFRKKQK